MYQALKRTQDASRKSRDEHYMDAMFCVIQSGDRVSNLKTNAILHKRQQPYPVSSTVNTLLCVPSSKKSAAVRRHKSESRTNEDLRENLPSACVNILFYLKRLLLWHN